MDRILRASPLLLLYLGQFILSFHFFFLVYINSSYLEELFGKPLVGTFYLLGAILSVVGLIKFPYILKRTGTHRALLLLLGLEMGALVGLFLFRDAVFAAPFFLIHLAMFPLAVTLMDLFLERGLQSEEHTGLARSSFLTTANTALLLAPFAVGLLIAGDNYPHAYLFAALFLIPFILIALSSLRHLDQRSFTPLPLRSTLSCLLQNANMRYLFGAALLLQLFYFFMVVYTPIYLHEEVGFSWPTIGFMFTVMLLPFVLFELPAGRLSDTRFGEKEMLIGGFLVLSLFTMALSSIEAPSVLLWTLLLFMTRVGAALVESMTDVFFFKHVTAADTNSVSIFRMLMPLSYIAGPLLAGAALLFIPLGNIFIFIGILTLLGVPIALQLTDTR